MDDPYGRTRDESNLPLSHQILNKFLPFLLISTSSQLSFGGYTHEEELIINFLSTFFQIYIFFNLIFLDKYQIFGLKEKEEANNLN